MIKYEIPNLPIDTNSPVDIMGVKNDNLSSVVYDNNIIGVLSVTNKGLVNITKSPIREGVKLVNLEDDEYLVYSAPITQEEYDNKIIMLLAEDGNLAKFKLSTVRLAGQGSGLINGMNNEKVVGAIISDNSGEIITYSDESIKLTSIVDIPTTGRGVKGSMLHKPMKEELLTGILLNRNKVISDKDTNMRLPEVSGRAARGEKINSVRIKYVGN